MTKPLPSKEDIEYWLAAPVTYSGEVYRVLTAFVEGRLEEVDGRKDDDDG